MVDVTQAMEGTYLTCDIVRDSPTKKMAIVDAGEYKEATYENKKYEKFELTVEIDFKKKSWAPNKDSIRNLAAAYGRDSRLWVGKICQATIQKVNGKDGIVAYPMPEIKVSSEQV
jgi:hypothetical protein